MLPFDDRLFSFEEENNSVFFLTNQLNLREILSSRFIGNLYSYDGKYYPDLLSDSNGWIPLFTKSIGRDLVAKVNEHDPEISYSVILEIDLRLVEDSDTPKFPHNIKRKKRNSSADHYCIAWNKVIPFSSVKAVHFLTEDNKNDFSIRSYSDMPSPKHLFRVSPYIVKDPSSLLDDSFLEWLHNLPVVEMPTSENFQEMDRISGAVALCCSISKTRLQRDYLLKLINPEFHNEAPINSSIPVWFKNGLFSRLKNTAEEIPDSDQALFDACLAVLHRSDISLVKRSSKFISEIERELDKLNLEEVTRNILSTALDYSRRYAANELELEPKKPQPGFHVAKALVLFILRPNPESLLKWSPKETGADELVMLTAAAFAGLLRGRKGLNTSYRPEDLDIELAQNVVDSLNTLIVSIDPGSLSIEKAIKSSADITLSKEKPSNKRKKTANKKREDTQTVVDEPILKPFLESLLEADHTVHKELSLRICREMNWMECVKTSVTSPSNEMNIINNNTNGFLLNIKGFVEVNIDLNIEFFVQKIRQLQINDERLKKFESYDFNLFL